MIVVLSVLPVDLAAYSNRTVYRLRVRRVNCFFVNMKYRGAGKSLARPGRKQAAATEDFDVRISYLLS